MAKSSTKAMPKIGGKRARPIQPAEARFLESVGETIKSTRVKHDMTAKELTRPSGLRSLVNSNGRQER